MRMEMEPNRQRSRLEVALWSPRVGVVGLCTAIGADGKRSASAARKSAQPAPVNALKRTVRNGTTAVALDARRQRRRDRSC